jgi:hypothetical protein
LPTAHKVEFYKENALKAGAHGIVSKCDFDGLVNKVKILLESKCSCGCI